MKEMIRFKFRRILSMSGVDLVIEAKNIEDAYMALEKTGYFKSDLILISAMKTINAQEAI